MAKKKPTLELLETATEEAANTMASMMPPPDLSLGCDLLDLCVGDHVGAAIGPGRYIWIQGSSSTGKTILTLVAFAEANKRPQYDKHRFLFFDGERGSGFDLAKLLGKNAAARIEHMTADTIEHFYDQMDRAMDAGPIIAVLDSFDSLLPETVLNKIDEDAKLREENKKIGASYGMEGAKLHALRLRKLVSKLYESGSIFLGVSQTRMNLDAGLYGPKNKPSGGTALRFWASVEIETALGSRIDKEVNNKKRTLGYQVKIKSAKNRITGKVRDIEVALISGFGIDNTLTSVNWLIGEGYLKLTSGRVESPWYDKAYYKEELCKKIEDDDKEADLQAYLQASWSELEAALASTRKPRYE